MKEMKCVGEYKNREKIMHEYHHADVSGYVRFTAIPQCNSVPLPSWRLSSCLLLYLRCQTTAVHVQLMKFALLYFANLQKYVDKVHKLTLSKIILSTSINFKRRGEMLVQAGAQGGC